MSIPVFYPILEISDLNKKFSTESNKYFIKSFASDHNKKNISFTFNGRNALYFILKKLNMTSDDEVIIPSFTCRSIYNAVNTLATAVCADIDFRTLNMTPDSIRAVISPKTKAVVVVHSYGNPCEITEIKKICLEYNLTLIEDVAAAIGAKYDSIRLGGYGNFSFFSFYFTKDVTSYNGAAILSNTNSLVNFDFTENEYLTKFKLLNFLSAVKFYPGLSSALLSKFQSVEKKQILSIKDYTLSDFQINLLSIQYNKLGDIVAARRKNVDYYRDCLDAEFQLETKRGLHNYFRLPIFCKSPSKLQKILLSNGILSERRYNYSLSEQKNGINAANSVLCIPVHHNLTQLDLEKITSVINTSKDLVLH